MKKIFKIFQLIEISSITSFNEENPLTVVKMECCEAYESKEQAEIEVKKLIELEPSATLVIDEVYVSESRSVKTLF